MAKKQSKTTNQGGRKRKAHSETIREVHHMPSLMQVFYETHRVTVAHCKYCGRPISRSDVNDGGSLCPSCFRREYGYDD